MGKNNQSLIYAYEFFIIDTFDLIKKVNINRRKEKIETEELLVNSTRPV